MYGTATNAAAPLVLRSLDEAARDHDGREDAEENDEYREEGDVAPVAFQVRAGQAQPVLEHLQKEGRSGKRRKAWLPAWAEVRCAVERAAGAGGACSPVCRPGGASSKVRPTKPAVDIACHA